MNEVKQFTQDSTQNITLTDTCKEHVVDFIKKNNKKGLRLSTKKTGCSGLSYVLDYVDEQNPDDDIVITLNELTIYVDRLSYPYLKNTTIDYVKEGLNYRFVFNNPNKTGQCGCGESFTVDDF